MLRTLGAFVVAPFPVALLQSVVVGLWPKIGRGVFEHPLSMFITICLYFYFFGLLLGVPAWLAIRRRSPGLGSYLLIGVIIALLPDAAALLVGVSRGQGSAYIVIYNLALFGFGGAAAGALFWLLAVRKKPAAALKDTFG